MVDIICPIVCGLKESRPSSELYETWLMFAKDPVFFQIGRQLVINNSFEHFGLTTEITEIGR